MANNTEGRFPGYFICTTQEGCSYFTSGLESTAAAASPAHFELRKLSLIPNTILQLKKRLDSSESSFPKLLCHFKRPFNC